MTPFFSLLVIFIILIKIKVIDFNLNVALSVKKSSGSQSNKLGI